MDEKQATELLQEWLDEYYSALEDNRNDVIANFLESYFYEIAVRTFQFVSKDS